MKPLNCTHHHWNEYLGFGPGTPLILTMLLAPALAAHADTDYTATGWVTSVPIWPIVCTNAAGQVLMRANAHVAAVQQSTDERLIGNRVIFANAAFRADGTAQVWGTAYQQVGTFDANTNFTPTAGLWEITYSGVMQADYSLQLSLVGSGSGGAIDGQRITETMTRGVATGPIDPTVPYLYTGTIKPAPVNLRRVVDNFDDNLVTGWTRQGPGLPLLFIESNRQFTVPGKWPGITTHKYSDTYAWGWKNTGWSVTNDQTLEFRVDLVAMSEDATNAAAIAAGNVGRSQMYIVHKGRDFIDLGKWVGPAGMAVFFFEHRAIKNTNVVLSLALTRTDPNLVLTARVLDKDNQEAVLYQRTVVDTPQADATLTSEQLLALSGMDLTIVTDIADAPITSGDRVYLTAWQYTDGNQPEADVTYDNLEMRTTEIPPIGLERAVRLSWPTTGLNYTPQWAPTPQGPWQPVPDQTIPGMNQMTIPASGTMGCIRLIQAP